MRALAPPHAAASGQPGVLVEPPPPGVASGRWTVSRTSLAIVGALVIALGVAYVSVRALRARRGA